MIWKWKYKRLVESICIWVVWHLPRSLVYWSGIRLLSHATTGTYSHHEVQKVTLAAALVRWEK